MRGRCERFSDEVKTRAVGGTDVRAPQQYGHRRVSACKSGEPSDDEASDRDNRGSRGETGQTGRTGRRARRARARVVQWLRTRSSGYQGQEE